MEERLRGSVVLMLFFGRPKPLYTITVHQPDGTVLADISRIATSRQFSVRRNRGDAITLGMDLYAAERLAIRNKTTIDDLFAEGRNEIRIRRGDRPMAAGQIAVAESALGSSGFQFQVQAIGYLDLLKDRYLHPSSTDPAANTTTLTNDIGEVMWWFINYTQNTISVPPHTLTNGSFGMTRGIIQTSRSLTDTWQPWATSIRDILIAITERIDSVDMAFSIDKAFNVYYPGIGGDKTELLFSYPGNIIDFRLPKDATGLVNTAIVRGSGNGSDQQVATIRQNTAAQTAFSRREGISDYPSINVLQTLQDKGDETLRLKSSSVKIPDIVLDGSRGVPLGAYWIGDRVRFAVPNRPSLAQLNGQTWRIGQIDVSINENDYEQVTLKVELS